ncbi:MAG: rRNA maturation RNase YbeY [Oscillospiraceae bacterium]|jgi:probable rRNA maturation factor|nr:rRNA maturation RNase YbeY [Oscillospiraceae bacterium]
MRPNITITRERGVQRVVSHGLLRAAVIAALTAESVCNRVNVSILLCSRRSIRALNRRFRGVDRVTDVLSFPDGEGGGDIALCVRQLTRQARGYGHSIQREAAYLVVHAVLHLLGYDHETGEADERRMRDLAEAIMAKLGLKRGTHG